MFFTCCCEKSKDKGATTDLEGQLLQYDSAGVMESKGNGNAQSSNYLAAKNKLTLRHNPGYFTPCGDVLLIPLVVAARLVYMSQDTFCNKQLTTVDQVRQAVLVTSVENLSVLLFHFMLRLTLFCSEAGFACVHKNLFTRSTAGGGNENISPRELVFDFVLLSTFAVVAGWFNYGSYSLPEVISVGDSTAFNLTRNDGIIFGALYMAYMLLYKSCCIVCKNDMELRDYSTGDASTRYFDADANANVFRA